MSVKIRAGENLRGRKGKMETEEENETQKGQIFLNLLVLCKKISLSSHRIFLTLICHSILHQGVEELQFNIFQHKVEHLLIKVPA